ncbi:MAG: glucose-6-phosphate isomerase [Clostridiales bacterium]|nr:glucose-6-phosphate isomerase [Clostridiales bacterium]
MGAELNIDTSNATVSEEDLIKYKGALKEAQDFLNKSKEGTGWVRLPFNYDRSELKRIQSTAVKIQEQCQVFVVIGIGGSYLGARAAIEMLGPLQQNLPEIYYAGINISGSYHAELIDRIKDKDICICVISKSGNTTETAIAFSLFKQLLLKKYGKQASERIYVITDKEKGVLREEAEREGYVSFVIPDDIGGRYSVLTPVGLLPMAVAGIDIESVLDGALKEAELADRSEKYAAIRNELFNRGKLIEIFEYYEPRLHFFAEWLKQLFGESEGKEGKGIFPAALALSTDLHSMGQYLQEGNQIFFETILNVEEPKMDIVVPESAGSFLAGKSMNQINRAAMEGVIEAHKGANIPMIKIDIPVLNPYNFGRLVYFFEKACALSGCLMGVNPFDQPGVESYKSEMRKALK